MGALINPSSQRATDVIDGKHAKVNMERKGKISGILRVKGLGKSEAVYKLSMCNAIAMSMNAAPPR